MAIESRVAGDRLPALQVRPETPQDFAAIRRVHRLAFGEHSPEADLVDALRAAEALEPDLCMVALDGEDVIGHIAFSRARLDSGAPVLALGPMGVVPAAQRRGAGSALMRKSLHRAAETDYPLVVVVGHPEYYPRFGFERGDAHDIRTSYEVPPEAWMVLRLPAYRSGITGLVIYPDEFGLVS
jgi:putative acetyltransferase